jgi:indoleamine 2,3-dioxygenase
MLKQSCWDTIWPDRGFLCNPDPLISLNDAETPLSSSVIEQLEDAAGQLPDRLADRSIRDWLAQFPTLDLTPIHDTPTDFRVVERLMTIYAYLASAYVHMEPESPAKNIPAGIARPLAFLSGLVDRPPILTYTNYVLTNWQRKDPAGGIEVDNLELVQKFLGNDDEAWFILIHVDIEARAAAALRGIIDGKQAVAEEDPAALHTALQAIETSIAAMIQTFDRMPEGCDSDVYYYRVRPYIFMFQDVTYNGVSTLGGEPKTFRGQTGAQSSIVPALVEALELQHEASGLTHHLKVMRHYMPKPHREFIASNHESGIRGLVRRTNDPALDGAYNACLTRLLEFRRMHYHYATTYIAEKVKDPMGTGGTIFMDWLARLAEETEAQMV